MLAVTGTQASEAIPQAPQGQWMILVTHTGPSGSGVTPLFQNPILMGDMCYITHQAIGRRQQELNSIVLIPVSA